MRFVLLHAALLRVLQDHTLLLPPLSPIISFAKLKPEPWSLNPAESKTAAPTSPAIPSAYARSDLLRVRSGRGRGEGRERVLAIQLPPLFLLNALERSAGNTTYKKVLIAELRRRASSRLVKEEEVAE
jgi:hypothetical protein